MAVHKDVYEFHLRNDDSIDAIMSLLEISMGKVSMTENLKRRYIVYHNVKSANGKI